MEVNEYRSLVELTEGVIEVPEEPESLGMAVGRLVTKPLRRLELKELLLLVHHHVGLPYVVPMAIDRLEGQPWAQARHCPGDLLIALMEADSRFWREREDLWLAMVPLLEEAVNTAATATEAAQAEEAYAFPVGDDFMAALLHFRGLHTHD